MAIKSFFAHIIFLLFPEKCVVCSKEGVSLCDSCVQTLPQAPLLEEPWMHSLFSYQDKGVRTIVHALKFNHTQSIAEHIAPLMHDIIQDIQSQNLAYKETPLVLLPVPRMHTHLKKRGFDAVLHLSSIIYLQNKNLYEIDSNTIVRTNTKAQVGLPRSERLINMKNAFKTINGDKIQNRQICIVDDVTTTGSTLRELRNTLLKSGAKDVFAVTIAH